jgi:dihydrofolate reductase
VRIRLVVAVAENGVIGRDGGMPWRLSTDMKRFKATTMGKPVVMGRKTWESFPKRPLPGRHNIVITRDPAYAAEGASVAASLEAALALAGAEGAQEVCVIGGGEVYAAALPLADSLDVTHILAEIDGDTRFPAIDPAIWREASSEDFPPGDKDSHATRHVVYERREQAGAGRAD